AMFPASSAGVSRSVSSPSRPRCTTLTTFFLSSSAAPRHLHSFPTRRSSDLPLPLPHRRPPLGERPGGGRVRPQSLRHRGLGHRGDRKSTRLNSSHVKISYAVFCLKKKKNVGVPILFVEDTVLDHVLRLSFGE